MNGNELAAENQKLRQRVGELENQLQGSGQTASVATVQEDTVTKEELANLQRLMDEATTEILALKNQVQTKDQEIEDLKARLMEQGSEFDRQMETLKAQKTQAEEALREVKEVMNPPTPPASQS